LFDLDLLLEIGVLFRDSEVPVIFTEQPLTLTTARLRPGDAVEAVKGFHLQIGATVCPHPGHDGIAEALVVRVRFADVHPVAEALVAGAAIIGACRGIAFRVRVLSVPSILGLLFPFPVLVELGSAGHLVADVGGGKTGHHQVNAEGEHHQYQRYLDLVPMAPYRCRFATVVLTQLAVHVSVAQAEAAADAVKNEE